MNALDPELVALIFAHGKTESIGNALPWRSVCRLWRKLLPLREGEHFAAADELCTEAVLRDRRSLLTWTKRNGIDWTGEMCAAAAGAGMLDTLEWLRNEGCPWDSRCYLAAVCAKDLATLRWLRRKGCPWDCRVESLGGQPGERTVLWDQVAYLIASADGELEMLSWLRKRGCAWSDRPFPVADACGLATYTARITELRRNLIEVCKRSGRPPYHTRLRSHVLQLTESVWTLSVASMACAWAAHGGHRDVLSWLRDDGCAWDAWTCAGAAAGGRLDILDTLIDAGCPWNGATLTAALRYRHADAFEWALARGCPCTGPECETAAELGDLDLLKDLAVRSGMRDEHVYDGAVRGGHRHVLEWALDNGYPHSVTAYGAGARAGRFDILRWLDARQPFPLSSLTCLFAAAYGSVEDLAWARDRGDPLDERLPRRYARDRPTILIWLLRHGCPGIEVAHVAALVLRDAASAADASALLTDLGLSLNADVCAAIANLGSVEALAMARALGCPWDVRVREFAERDGYLHLLRWAVARGVP